MSNVAGDKFRLRELTEIGVAQLTGWDVHIFWQKSSEMYEELFHVYRGKMAMTDGGLEEVENTSVLKKKSKAYEEVIRDGSRQASNV